jgi:hypothetical protein
MQLSRLHDSAGWAPAHVLLERFADARSPLFTPEQLFEAFLAPRIDPGPSRIYFNHEIEKNVFNRQGDAPTPPEYLPGALDGTWVGYSERVKAAIGGGRYCLRMTEVHAHSPAIYKRLAEHLSALEPAFAAGDRCVRTTIFMGDYDFTPFGVHVDPYPQIQSVVSGSRSALFWESSYWEGRAAAERLAPWDHLAAARKVTMGAGDAVYWAGDYEHAFRSCADAFSGSGQLSIAITISFPEVPAPETATELARRRSAHHFLNVPLPRATREWGSDQLFRGEPLFALAIASRSDEEIVLVGGGCTVGIPADPALEGFVARVRTGDPFRFADFAALGEENARALVDLFYERYCIEAV